MKNSSSSKIFMGLLMLFISVVGIKWIYHNQDYVKEKHIPRITETIKKYMPARGTIWKTVLQTTNTSKDVPGVPAEEAEVQGPMPSFTSKSTLNSPSEAPAISNRQLPEAAVSNRHLPEACGGVFTFPIDKKSPQPFKHPEGMSQTEEHFYRYTLQYIDAQCDGTVRAGKLQDGGWDICISGPFQMIAGECKVLSFGINNDFSFDDFMVKTFNCTVHSFDPSMANLNDTRRSEKSWFHKLGLSGSDTVNDKAWKLQTLKTILADLSWTDQVIDVLKFDIESSEISALPTMLSDHSLSNVKQLSFELHSKSVEKKPDKQIPLLTGILEKLSLLGFRKFLFHENLQCISKAGQKWGKWQRSRCTELYFINEKYVDEMCRLW